MSNRGPAIQRLCRPASGLGSVRYRHSPCSGMEL